MRSENFLVLGQAGEPELRSMTMRLEEFRAVFSQLLTKDYFDSSTPTVVLVFANDDEYKFFKPLYHGQPDQYVAGYFRASSEVNYITLSATTQQENMMSVLFHEYVHLLVKNRYGHAPLWFDEGLAEYYSAYDLLNNKQKIRLGKRLPNRVNDLRTHELLPLTSLLTIDRYSPLYNEHDQRNVFYAQSWALIHYLLNDKTAERRRQLSDFIDMLTTGVSIEDEIRQAFHISPAMLERKLREYIRFAQYPERIESLVKQPVIPSTAQTTVLTEAEAQAYLGDLLLCIDRTEDAQAYLEKSLTLNSNLAEAHVSLGTLRLRENRLAEAREHLQRALTADPQNYLAHYHYGDLLRREATESEEGIAGYVEKANLARAELKEAIKLAPSFLNAYALLALVGIEMSPQLDEAAEVLNQAMALAPGRQEFKLLQAQLYVRREQFEIARSLLNALIHDQPATSLLRMNAQTLLDSMSYKEKIAADRKKLNDGAPTVTTSGVQPLTQPCDMPEPGPQLKPARFFGEQTCGQLVRIDCADAGVLLFVAAGKRTLKLHSDALSNVKFVTYTREATNKIECGQQSGVRRVLVTYRQLRGDNATKAASDGELVAVEFVPEEWVH